MKELRTELPDEILGWLADAAARFDVTREEIVRRALEQYLETMGRVEAEFVRLQTVQTVEDSASEEQKILPGRRKEDCPFHRCPFERECPGEECPL